MYISSGPSALCGIICDKILKTIASQMQIFDSSWVDVWNHVKMVKNSMLIKDCPQLVMKDI